MLAKGLSGFGGLLSEFANRLMTFSHGAALEALFAFPFLISVDFVFFPLVDGKPTLDSPTDIQIKRWINRQTSVRETKTKTGTC